MICLQDLIDFCKDTGLQSSAAATRNATIKLLGALHKFVGPGDYSFYVEFYIWFIFIFKILKTFLFCRHQGLSG